MGGSGSLVRHIVPLIPRSQRIFIFWINLSFVEERVAKKVDILKVRGGNFSSKTHIYPAFQF